VVVGILIGHEVTTGRRRQEWKDPVGRMAAHLDEMDAGADHACVQVISGRDDDACLPALRELAGALL
jgi:hypothetical protein